MTDKPVPIRLDQEILDRLERIAAALSERLKGARMTRADATRIALERGAEALEKELGLSRLKRKPKPTK